MTNRRRDPARGPRGMQPAGQHGTSSPDAGPSRGRARRSLGRLVVTPTFTAGACIVFAAVLAYGTTQTHMAFRRLGPPCAGASCPAAGRGHAGVVRPRRAAAPAGTEANGYSRRGAGPARPRAGPDPDANAGGGKLAGDMSSVAASPGLPVVIAYRTVRRWHGGFAAMMTITNRSGSAIASWRLFVRYRRARDGSRVGSPLASGRPARAPGRGGGPAARTGWRCGRERARNSRSGPAATSARRPAASSTRPGAGSTDPAGDAVACPGAQRLSGLRAMSAVCRRRGSAGGRRSQRAAGAVSGRPGQSAGGRDSQRAAGAAGAVSGRPCRP